VWAKSAPAVSSSPWLFSNQMEIGSTRDLFVLTGLAVQEPEQL